MNQAYAESNFKVGLKVTQQSVSLLPSSFVFVFTPSPLFLLLQGIMLLIIMHLSMSWQGGGGGGRVGIWLSLLALGTRAFDWSCSPRGGGYFILSSPDAEIFDCRLGQKRLRPNICFPLPCFTHAPYSLERSGNHGGQQEQAKAEWISLFCFQISFGLPCFLSIEPLKILWYQSKR